MVIYFIDPQIEGVTPRRDHDNYYHVELNP